MRLQQAIQTAPLPFFFRDLEQLLPSVSDNSPNGSPVIHAGQTEQDENSAGGPGVSSSGTIEQGTGSPAPSGGGAAAPEIPQPPSGETPPEAGSGDRAY